MSKVKKPKVKEQSILSEGLAETLVNKTIIKPGTWLYARYTKQDYSLRVNELEDTFLFEAAKKTDKGYFIKASRLSDGWTTVFPCTNVMKIEDMSPKAFAGAYDLKPSGDIKDLGKRRGRPRKYIINGLVG